MKTLVQRDLVEKEEVHAVDHDLAFAVTLITIGLRALFNNLVDNF